MLYTFKIFLITIFLISIFTTTTIYADENYSIPTWIKTNAEWWSNNQIDDETFATAIEFLINDGVIIIPDTSTSNTNEDIVIPNWVKTNAAWWASNQINDLSFIQSIQFLIENGIIKINKINENEINFAITADLAVNSETMKNLQNIERVDPEIILFSGDIRNDDGPPPAWFELQNFLGKDRIRVAIGNHDVNNEKWFNEYMTYYNMPKTFYSFDSANVHFIVLDTEKSIYPSSEQLNFLLNDLENNTNNSKLDWIIVAMHRPMYSDGENIMARGVNQHLYGNNLLMTEQMIIWRTTLQPIFDYYNVDLVIQGHNHFFERTKPIIFDSVVTDANLSNYVDVDGQIYLTVGTGGYKMDKPLKKSDLSIKQIEEFGFLNLKLSPDKKTLSGEFINLEEKILDKFEIKKEQIQKIPSLDIDKELLFGKDLSGQNLFLKNLSSSNLSNTDLRFSNLGYADLSNANLSGADLRNANLQGVNLSGFDLSGFDLSGANLTYHDFTDIDLSQVTLENTVLFGTILIGQDLSGKNLSGVNMKLSNLSIATLKDTDLSGANLQGSVLINTDISNANLENVNTSYSYFLNLNFTDAQISDMDFSNSIVYGSDFRSTDLNDTNFSGALLADSNFSNQDLRNSDFTNADFSPKTLGVGNDVQELFGIFAQHANFEGNDSISDVFFSRADSQNTYDFIKSNHEEDPNFRNTLMEYTKMYNDIINGADLSGANLSGADLSKKNMDRTNNLVLVNFSNANLENSDLSQSLISFTNLSGANLTNANLENADLMAADLSGANLSGANLSGANLFGADLSGANLSGANLSGANLNCNNHDVCK